MFSKYFFNPSVLLCGMVILSSCSPVTDSHLQVNQQLASPYTMPAGAYLALAKNQDGYEQHSLTIMAAGRLIHDGHWQEGRRILARLNDLPTDLRDQKQLLLAKIELIRERPKSAIASLSSVQDINNLSMYYQAQFHELLAQAYQQTGHASESVTERIKLENLLPDGSSKANNLRALWLTLTSLPQSELHTLAAEAPENAELKGWMQLALISRKHYSSPDVLMSAVGFWQTQYPQHPANGIVQAKNADKLFAKPKQVAVLLPLSGPLGGPGAAVRDGFMAAYAVHSAKTQAEVKFYDTQTGDVADLYQRAIINGADYVVGPLTKKDVATVAKINHPVPTVLLNDVSAHAKSDAYQFGISPENEARQVAVKARKSGLTRALIIAPSGSWGNDVTSAFASQWRASGGKIVDTLAFDANDNLSQSIRDLLHISDSEARKKQMKKILGHNIESTPRRRQDFDMVFLLAYPSKARQIMPLLKYYYAGDIPVYSTSIVYAGSPNSMKDRDLDGIIFCDMPWVFEQHQSQKNWPEQFNSYNRLYALGMDSYALSSQLNQLLLFPAMGVHDKSGVLYLNPNQQIARILAWGQFKQGIAHPINET